MLKSLKQKETRIKQKRVEMTIKNREKKICAFKQFSSSNKTE